MLRSKMVRNNDGIATTEFALIAPTLIVLICGFVEFAWVASGRAALESATMRAARLIAASDCPAQRDALLTKTIVDQMSYMRSSDGQPPTIEKKSYSKSFGDVGEPEPFADKDTDDSTTLPTEGNGEYDLGEIYTEVNGPDVNGITKWDADMGKSGSVGAAGQVVSYTAKYKVKSMIPWVAKKFRNGADHYPIQATTVIRNEPVFRTTGCPS